MKEVTQYLHCDKCSVAEQCREDGITDDDKIRSVIGAVYEVEFRIDADTGTILSIQSGSQTFKEEK
jgi:hypothetical protein